MNGPEIAKSVAQTTRRYIVDGARSDARFRVKKFGPMYTVKGNFGDSISGDLAVGDDRMSARGFVELCALTTGQRGRDKHFITVRERDKHLRTADFFDAARYPRVGITADDVPISAAAIEAVARITIKDVTRTVPATVTTTRQSGALRVEVEGEINRRDFDITPPSFFYDKVVVAARVRFKVTLVATTA